MAQHLGHLHHRNPLGIHAVYQRQRLPRVIGHFSQLHLGGGTPTYHHPKELGSLLEHLFRAFDPTDGAELAELFPENGLDLEERLEDIRRTYMRAALERAGGVQKKAAALLGMSFRSFRYYLEKLGLREGEAESELDADETTRDAAE